MRTRLIATLILLGACSKEAPPPVYQAVPVERRDIVVSAQASGAIQPDTTVEVKTRASGEVLEILALLTPYEVPEMTRRRFGNRGGDGGYVLLEQLLTDQPVISAGIGRQISFDLEMAERGHEVHMFDHTIAAPPATACTIRCQKRSGLCQKSRPRACANRNAE